MVTVDGCGDPVTALCFFDSIDFVAEEEVWDALRPKLPLDITIRSPRRAVARQTSR